MRVPVQYELVKNYICGLKQGDALVGVPIELEATVSDYIQRLRMGNLIDSKSEAQAIIIAVSTNSLGDNLKETELAKAFDIEQT